jgi:hypothetical protein
MLVKARLSLTKTHLPRTGVADPELTVVDDTYWQGRKDLEYYRTVHRLAARHCPDGTSLLDVGGGVGLGCRYLEWFGEFTRTSVETPTRDCILDGVRVVHSDFADWERDCEYDLVLCLQVLEHIPDAESFARKIFESGRVVIISVPYMWKSGVCSEHVHDPVNEEKLQGWTGRSPTESCRVDSRLVAVFA